MGGRRRDAEKARYGSRRLERQREAGYRSSPAMRDAGSGDCARVRSTGGSDDGGRTAAVLTSFITTCKALHIDPFRYLRNVFKRISAYPSNQLSDLLPDKWMAAREAATAYAG